MVLEEEAVEEVVMDRTVVQLLLRDTLLAKNLTTALEDMIATAALAEDILAAEVVADIHLL